MSANFSREPIDGAERQPTGLDPFSVPVFYTTPLEPIGGGLLIEPGCFLEIDAGCFLDL